MDYKDRISGLGDDYFTPRGQLYLVDMLFRRMKPFRKLSILSIGCGDGNELEILNKYGSVDVLDKENKAIKLIPKSAYVNAFIEDICQFTSSKKYDVVCGFDVLEHIKDDDIALERIYDALSDEGHFVFTVPAHSKLFSAHDKALNHFRRYDRKDFIKLLNKRFDVSFLSYRYFFHFLPVSVDRILHKNAMPKIQAPKLPKALNDISLLLLRVEISLMGLGIHLPIGINLVGISKRKKSVK